MINQRYSRERFDYNEYIFKPMQGTWTDSYATNYLPLRFTEEENDRMVEGLPIYKIPEKVVVSCSKDCCGRIYAYVGPRSTKNHNPIHWDNVGKFFESAVTPDKWPKDTGNN